MRCVCACACLFDILLINPLAPHEDLGLMVQGEGPVIFPEAVEQFQVFEFPVLVTYWKTGTKTHKELSYGPRK